MYEFLNFYFQEFVVGKYIIKWCRRDTAYTEPKFASVTSFDLANIKVCLSTLFAEAKLPAFGIVRTPLTVVYTLYNQTKKVQEFALSIDPSEAFMMSGNKQLHFKILPERKYYLTYVLYPLLAGAKVRMYQVHTQYNNKPLPPFCYECFFLSSC